MRRLIPTPLLIPTRSDSLKTLLRSVQGKLCAVTAKTAKTTKTGTIGNRIFIKTDAKSPMATENGSQGNLFEPFPGDHRLPVESASRTKTQLRYRRHLSHPGFLNRELEHRLD